MEAPEWNAEDRQGSLKSWIDMLSGEARRQFLEDGTHIEIFFIFNADGLMEIVPVAGMDREEAVRALKTILTERNGYAFIHISEADMELKDGSHRAGALMVHAESRDGFSVLCCSTVAERDGEKLLLDPVVLEGAKLDGRFAGVFRDIEPERG
jgi:hypothetical protein